jgi:hypothetical protein
VDLGNNFPEATPQGQHKIALIRELLGRFAPQAVLPGPGELALGSDALADGLPYVLSNAVLSNAVPRNAAAGHPAPNDGVRGGTDHGTDDPGWAPVRTVTRAGRSVGLYGYLSPRAVYQGEHSGLRLRPADDALLADLRRRVRGVGHPAAVLLFRGDDTELAVFVRAGLFDLIVAGNPSADEMNQVTQRTVAGAAIPQVPTKGQGVLRLALPVARTAVPAAGPPRVDWLDGSWADHPAATPVFAAYDERVKALFFARLETLERQRTESPFAGAQTCAACHAVAARVWQASRHGHALATLERVGKQHDPECLACHVVGLERGGYLSADLTPQLANVQCENCHGPARAHLADPARAPGPVPIASGGVPAAAGPGVERPGEATCRTCHVGSHSPNFDFSAYWPKVAHPTSQ